jgi:hypothetical protein
MHIFYLPTTAYTATPFCSSNLLFIQQLLGILYSFKEKKKKTDLYYVLKEILYEILSLEASIQGEKIVTNNLQLDRLKLLLNEVLSLYLVAKITPTMLFDSTT